MRLSSLVAALALAAVLSSPAVAQTLIPITIGVVPSLPAAPTFLALEKGYFRDAGIDAKLEILVSAAKAIPLLASNQMQVVEGGLSVGYFNALAQGLPITLTLERGSSPLNHVLIVRNDLKDQFKTVADLKGRSIALVAQGSIIVYELGKVLETAGLSMKDVDVKWMPFPQMGVALANKGVDVAFEIPPFSNLVLDKSLGTPWLDPDDFITPQPMSIIAYMVNTDWAAKNHEVALRLFTALVRGGREYCQAYHNGPNRKEVEDVLIKYGGMSDIDLLRRMPWQVRDPNGRFNLASVIDVQDWFYKEKLIDKKLPPDRLVDGSYAEAAAKELGPFEVINKGSTLKGCR